MLTCLHSWSRLTPVVSAEEHKKTQFVCPLNSQSSQAHGEVQGCNSVYTQTQRKCLVQYVAMSGNRVVILPA